MSLKIGNKNKLVYDWSLSVFGSCGVVFLFIVVLCSGFCVNRQMDPAIDLQNGFGKSICQIDLQNGSGKSICQIESPTRITCQIAESICQMD
jgi:hypothetical protein